MGVTLFNGMEIGEIPLTPAQPIFNSRSVVPVAYKTLVSCGMEFGFPISYIQEQNGALIQNLLPVHKTETQQISTSSKVQLELHTETAFHPYKPDYVLLLCLRGDSTAATTFASLEDFLPLLDDETIDALEQPEYITTLDESFRKQSKPDFKVLVQAIRKTDKGVSLTFDWELMRGTNDRAQAALELLRMAISQCVKEVVLESGDLLVIDNNKTVHGRKPFQARYDGTDRWVQRLLVRKTLPPVSHMSGTTITTQFGQY
jgi:hypothetical protein